MPEEIEVPTEHLHEKMEEAAKESIAERGWISRVAVSSAILAVAAAITALLASHHSDEAILEQMRATDQWSYYQAKGIKLAILQGSIEEGTSAGKAPSADKLVKVGEYEKEMAAIQAHGKELEASSEDHMGHHVWLARAVTGFQIAIAMGAIAVLARRPKIWIVSLAIGSFGAVAMIAGLA